MELDLSEVLFIATANVVDTIPGPLLDRMEVIALDGYTEDEKLAIARGYLLPRQVERNGLRDDEVDVRRRRPARRDRRLHARGGRARPGARDRQAAAQERRAASPRAARRPITIGPDDLDDALGRPRFHHEAAERTATPGVATGLAVTGTGGDVLFIEASAMPADGPGDRLVLTGQLGDVMRESARIALSWTRSHGTEVGIHPRRPARARRSTSTSRRARSPRTGPSAGVTMVTALASLATGRGRCDRTSA